VDGYHPTERAHDPWKHKTHPVWFLLVVDNFGINYMGYEYAEHLMTSIKKNYDISSDWTGKGVHTAD
jgi:hypothetical protein